MTLGLNIIQNKLLANLHQGVRGGQASSCAAFTNSRSVWPSDFKAGGITCVSLLSVASFSRAPIYKHGVWSPSVPIYLNRPSWPAARTTTVPLPGTGVPSKEVPIASPAARRNALCNHLWRHSHEAFLRGLMFLTKCHRYAKKDMLKAQSQSASEKIPIMPQLPLWVCRHGVCLVINLIASQSTLKNQS